MTLTLTRYALRACLPTRRRLGLLLPALGAVLFGLLAHLVRGPTRLHGFAEVSTSGLFGIVLPIGSMVIGDAVLGAEVRSGTMHFTWLSPVPRWKIVVGRWLASHAGDVHGTLLDLGAGNQPFRPWYQDKADRVIAIDVDGPVNAALHVVGADSVTQDRPMIVLARDTTTELRLLVTAPAENNPEKSVPVHFRVTDIGLGEVASATDHFVSP